MGVFSAIFSSIKKSKKLSEISKVLGKQMTTSEIMDSLLSRDDDSMGKAEEQLFDLIESDQNLKNIMIKYKADRKTLKEIYNMMNAIGAGQWVNGHYVSVSSLAFGGTLDYLLRNKEKFLTSYDDKMNMCYRLITYFQKNETGFISD